MCTMGALPASGAVRGIAEGGTPVTDAREQAFAKVNLYLEIAAKRGDGYHDIVSVMQTVSLSDAVRVERTAGEEVQLSVIGNDRIPADARNLAWRAAEAYFAASGGRFGVRIALEKRIPDAGGLAGGSADAAAVLRALNRLADTPLPRPELLRVALEVGSDVPFCLVGGTCLCLGRGERMTPVSSPEIWYVITNGGETVSTREAYQSADREPPGAADPDAGVQTCIRALNGGDLVQVAAALHNGFSRFVLPHCPVASARLAALADAGALGCLMSGSGSSVFGIFPSQEAAERAAAALPFPTFVAKSVPPYRF